MRPSGRFILVLTCTCVLALALSASHAGVTTRVSVASDGTQANDWNGYASCSSRDMRYIAFGSRAGNLVAGDTNGKYDVFLHDLVTGQTERVSVSSDGEQGDGDSGSWVRGSGGCFYYTVYGGVSVSADGRYVAFTSDASNLVPGDTNGYYDSSGHWHPFSDVFVRDRLLGTTTRLSVSSSGEQSNSLSHQAKITPDGRYAVFVSSGSDLVPGDTNGTADVFIRDIQLGIIELVSISSDGQQANLQSGDPCVSDDGRYVAFRSCGSNLIPADNNGRQDIFVRDRTLATTRRISVSSSQDEGNGTSYWPSISADGRCVAFCSLAGNLVPDDTNGIVDVFVRDCGENSTSRISLDSDGCEVAVGSQLTACISADGMHVAFDSYAANLVSGDTNEVNDVFVHDRQTGLTERVSVASDGAQGDGRGSSTPSISADGRFVVFASHAANLVPGDTNGYQDVFVHDRGAGSTPGGASICEFTLTPGTLASGTNVTARVMGPGIARVELRIRGLRYDQPAIKMAWDGSGWVAVISGALASLVQGDILLVWAHAYDAGGQSVSACRVLAIARDRPPREPGEPNAIWVDESSGLGILTGSATIIEHVARLSMRTSVWSPLGDRHMKLWPVGYPHGVPVEPAHEWSLCHDLALTNRFSPLGGPCYSATFGSSGDRASFHVTFDTASFALTMMDAAVNAARALLAKQGRSIPDVSPTALVKYADTIVNFGPFVRASGRFQPWPGARGLPKAVWRASRDLADIVKDKAAREVLRRLIERILQERLGDSTFVFQSQEYTNAMAGGVLSVYKLLMILHDLTVWAVQTWNGDPVIAFEAYHQAAGGLALSAVTASPSSNARSEGMEVRYESTALVDGWGYQFTVENLGGPSIWEVRLELDPEQPTPSAAAAPAGWSVEIGEDLDGKFVRWFTEGSGGWASGDFGGNAIPADASAAGFSVTMPSKIDHCCFTATDADLRIGGVVLIMTPALTPAPPDFAPSEGETTSMVCSIDTAASVSLAICWNGEQFVSLVSDTPKGAGELIVTWDGKGPSGEVAPLGEYEARLRVAYPDGTVADISEPLEVVNGIMLRSLGEIASLPEGREVRLVGPVATAGTPEIGGAFYAEADDRSAGIRVATDRTVNAGDLVAIAGVLAIEEGERRIVSTDMSVISSNNAIPRPLGMVSELLGGGSVGLIYGHYQHLSNVGLLVNAWGRVTQVGEGYLYIDDGSGLKDGTSTGAEENLGVRVICDPAGYSTAEKIEVTGISSCFWTPSGIARRILTRKPEDVRKLTGP